MGWLSECNELVRYGASGRCAQLIMKYSTLWIAAAIVPLFACSEKPHSPANPAETRSPLSLSQLFDMGNEVFPLPNGNAYLVSSFDRQLFLLSGDRAKRVDGVQLSIVETTIYPLPNSGAYLVSSDGSHLRLYYLVADSATLVQEGVIAQAALERTSVPSMAFLWSQLQTAVAAERRARKLPSDRETLQYDPELYDGPEPDPR